MDDFGMGYALGQDSGNARGDDGMWGGNGSWIFAFLIIALIFGGNGWGGGFGGRGASDAAIQGALTRGDLCSEFAFNDLQRAVAGVNSGLCEGFYSMNTGMLNGFNALGAQVANGFHGTDNAICQLGYQTAQLANGINLNTMQGFNGVTAGLSTLAHQLSDCCCETQRQVERGFCDVGYSMATNTCNIIQNAHNDTDRVIAKLDAMEMSRKDETISALRSQVEALNLAQSQANQNTYLINQLRPTAVPAYITCSPYESAYGWNRQGYGCGGSCGCGCGC